MMLQCSRCLVIPDVHQDIAWVARVLAQEPDCDQVVFLGDYFDTSLRRGPAGKAATCGFLLQVRQAWTGRVQFLLGNHDIQYLEARPAILRHQTARHHFYRCGSAYSGAGARQITKHLTPVFWSEARLFAAVNGFLLCHAGLAECFWPASPGSARTTTMEIERSLAALQRECDVALASLRHGPHPLLDVGRSRGGDAETGGLTWLDWDEEFADTLPLPQIVGHTGSDCGARQRGRSWCLDGHQTCYGVLTPTALELRQA